MKLPYKTDYLMKRNTNIPEVQIIFKRWEDILLNLRQNTGYMDGWYGLVAGHVEKWESFSQAAIREAQEESWVTLLPSQLKYVHTVHRKKIREREERVGVIFMVENLQTEPYNAEPDKSQWLFWINWNTLPKNTIPYIASCIQDIQNWITYSEVNN